MGYNSIISIMSKGVASAPVNTVAPVISGTNVVGNTLTTTNGTWTGSSPITYTYQWKRGASNIVGATSSTYVLVQADATNSITCVVTATNSVGSANATSNALTIFDSNANDFIVAESGAGVTLTSTQQNAINQLVFDLKAANIYSKFKALYPIIGGTATAHKFNLINPADTNAAFRLSFVGGWTHSSNGALPNGTNAYADTFLSPSIVPLTNNSTHLSVYSRTNTLGNYTDIGCVTGTSGNGFFDIILKWSDNNLYTEQYNFNTNRIAVANTNSQGFYISNRTSSTVFKLFKNGTQFGTTNTSASTPSVTTISSKVYLSAINNNGTTVNYSNRELAFASIGDGLTDAEALAFYNAVNAFQVTLARNV